MGNKIATRKPSEEAIRLARACVDKAKGQKIENMGGENVQKAQEVIAEIGKVWQPPETSKNEKTAQRSNNDITK